jgi:hypothetical protein
LNRKHHEANKIFQIPDRAGTEFYRNVQHNYEIKTSNIPIKILCPGIRQNVQKFLDTKA